MPIETTLLEADGILLVVVSGAVTGAEWRAWRMRIAAEHDMSGHHIVYDLLDYVGSVSDIDVAAVGRMLRENPTDRMTIAISSDPMLALWFRSFEPRISLGVPGRRFAVARSREEALARLRGGTG